MERLGFITKCILSYNIHVCSFHVAAGFVYESSAIWLEVLLLEVYVMHVFVLDRTTISWAHMQSHN